MGPDANLWFAEGAGHAVGTSTLHGAIAEFPLMPATAMPVSLVKSGGDLWIPEQTGNQLIQMSTAGVPKSYPLPTANAFPAHIVVGPDGALWFTENIANKIARFVPPTLRGGVFKLLVSWPPSIRSAMAIRGRRGGLMRRQAAPVARGRALIREGALAHAIGPSPSKQ